VISTKHTDIRDPSTSVHTVVSVLGAFISQSLISFTHDLFSKYQSE